MSSQELQTGSAPSVSISAEGRLVVRGSPGATAIRVSGRGYVSDDGGRFFVTCESHCEVIVPQDAFLKAVAAEKHTEIHGVHGEIGPVSVEDGNLMLRDIGPVVISEVAGNLNAEDVHGGLRADDVGGDARIKRALGQVKLGDVGGNVWFEGACEGIHCSDVGGNLDIRDAIGSIHVQDVGGDATVRGRAASVRIDDIGGNGRLYDVVCPVDVHDVGGNLDVHGSGPAHVSEVGGNFTVSGEIDTLVSEVGANFYGRDATLRGNVRLEVGGNAEFRLSPKPGDSCEIEAGGNVHCQLSDAVNAEIVINDAHGKQVLRAGSGGADVSIEAGGVVHISGASDVDVRRETREKGRKMGSFKIKLPRIPPIPPIPPIPGLPDIQGEIDNAFRAAGWPFESDPTRTERAKRGAPSFSWSMQTRDHEHQPEADAPADSGVREEERLAILRMLAEKKITLAQADQLLAALEAA